uniref:Predicted protein n=1 Tax=Hordeum vulgare subsp. vulgare TaxID=112509 RepID=F2EES1_HORVV|nr:predicted protein [Hordeum vulgare subsp. vulgare]
MPSTGCSWCCCCCCWCCCGGWARSYIPILRGAGAYCAEVMYSGGDAPPVPLKNQERNQHTGVCKQSTGTVDGMCVGSQSLVLGGGR